MECDCDSDARVCSPYGVARQEMERVCPRRRTDSDGLPMISDITCVILAGGLGTRLRSVVADVPKPLARVNGRPFLEYLIAQVRDAGCTDVILSVGYKAEAVESHFADGRDHGVRIRYVREAAPLGTAGALAEAEPLIASDPFLVMNGDSYCSVNLEAMLERHRSGSHVATLAAVRVEDRSRYGSLTIGADGAVVGFNEKGQEQGPGLINGGVYFLARHSIFRRIPQQRPCSLEYDVFPTLLGTELSGFTSNGFFIDIGTPEEWQRAQGLLSSEVP